MEHIIAGAGVAEFTTIQSSTEDGDALVCLDQVTTAPPAEPLYAWLTWASSISVQIEDGGAGHIGAHAHTNNTGELTALHEAIARADSRPAGTAYEEIRTDSLYAMNVTTGRWLPRSARNRDIVARLRCRWRRLQKDRPGEVRITHVRSHIDVPGNELADWLADHGRFGECTLSREDAQRWKAMAATWMAEWARGHGRGPDGPHGANTLGDRVGVG